MSITANLSRRRTSLDTVAPSNGMDICPPYAVAPNAERGDAGTPLIHTKNARRAANFFTPIGFSDQRSTVLDGQRFDATRRLLERKLSPSGKS
jgi:hypothetical protein